MIFAVFASNGFPSAFYTAELHGENIPAEAIEIADEQWEEFINHPGLRKWENGEVIAVEPSLPTPTITDYENAIQELIEETARSRKFRDAATMASYTSSTIPLWASQATAFVAWRDGVWMYAYGELDKVTNGLRPQPTVLEFLAELDPIVWP